MNNRDLVEDTLIEALEPEANDLGGIEVHGRRAAAEKIAALLDAKDAEMRLLLDLEGAARRWQQAIHWPGHAESCTAPVCVALAALDRARGEKKEKP